MIYILSPSRGFGINPEEMKIYIVSPSRGFGINPMEIEEDKVSKQRIKSVEKTKTKNTE